MKMFRLFTGMFALLMIAVAGCSNQSPDFSAVLKSIQISYTQVIPNDSGKIAVGDQLQFKATGLCTTPPGTKETDAGVVKKTIGSDTFLLAPCGVNVSDVTWTVDTSGNGSIDAATGLFTAGPGNGPVVVTGTANHISDSSTLNVDKITVVVTPVVLRSISITPASPPPVAQNGTVTFTVSGKGSDTKPFVLTPSMITWSPSCAATVATITPTTGSLTTTATAVATDGTCTITATSTANANGDTIAPATATFTISNDVALKHLVSNKLTPPSAAIPVGGKQDYQLLGVYGDGTTHPVPNSAINWTVSAGGIATIADNATDLAKETATGAKIGQATITATLKDASTLDDPTKNSATGALTVVDAACTTPLSNQNIPAATTATAVSGPLCLLCGVDSADNVIDANPTNSASLNATLGVGLPSNGVTLTVKSNAATPFAAGGHPGFLIADPTGALLSANVLNGNIQVSTLVGTTVQETSTPYVAGGLIPLPPLLDITLLGLGSGNGAYVTIPATKPFDAVQITFNTGLVSALSSVKVFGACAAVDTTKVTP